jgi:lysophospholipase L1-like esterase
MRKALAALVVATIAGVTAVAGAGAANAAVAAGDYVALGDSYAAGVGGSQEIVVGGDQEQCHQNRRSYPRSWTTVSDGKFTLKDRTCSGDTVDKVGKRLGDLGPKTTLVTVTVGGNDAEFVTTAETCVFGTDAECELAVVNSAWTSRLVLPNRLTALYQEIGRRAPKARIVVLGYPYLFNDKAESCVYGSRERRQLMNRAAEALGAGLQSGVEAAAKKGVNVTYVDALRSFDGHRQCDTTPWLTLNLHPDDRGHALYTFALAGAV